MITHIGILNILIDKFLELVGELFKMLDINSVLKNVFIRVMLAEMAE